MTPDTKCRIVILTDGEDNQASIKFVSEVTWTLPVDVPFQSNVTPSMLCKDLYDNDIVLDAIVIGTDSTRSLFKIARSTGGYAFNPQEQHVFFQIFLLETFIDIRTRPDIEKVSTKSGWDAFDPKGADMQDQFTFPPCRPHPNQSDYFISLRDAQKFWKRKELRSVNDPPSDAASSSESTLNDSVPTSTSSMAGARVLLSEVKLAVENAHPNMSIYVSESNVGFWKVIMKGPEDSPYQNGTFLLYVDIGLHFPAQPPACRFITQILHPNGRSKMVTAV
jgi:hypothetical protein